MTVVETTMMDEKRDSEPNPRTMLSKSDEVLHDVGSQQKLRCNVVFRRPELRRFALDSQASELLSLPGTAP